MEFGFNASTLGLNNKCSAVAEMGDRWPQYTNVTDRTGQTDNGPTA